MNCSKIRHSADFAVCDFLHDVCLDNPTEMDFSELRDTYCPLSAKTGVFDVDPNNLKEFSVKKMRHFLTELGCPHLSGSKPIVMKRLQKELKKHKIATRSTEKKEIRNTDPGTFKVVWVERDTRKISDTYCQHATKYWMDPTKSVPLLFQEKQTEYRLVGIISKKDNTANFNVHLSKLVTACYGV